MSYVHSHTVHESIHTVFGHEDGLEIRALEALKKFDLRDYVVYLKMEPHLLETLDALKKKGYPASREHEPDDVHCPISWSDLTSNPISNWSSQPSM